MSLVSKSSFSSTKAHIFKSLYVLLTLLIPTLVVAQQAGDFRSAGKGRWSNSGDKTIWEQYQSGYSAGWKIAFQADLGTDSVKMRSPGYDASKWVPAVVPGTVLTSYVAAGIEKEPGYGANIDAIDTGKYGRNVWYRAEFTVPKNYTDKHIWLNFHGLNKYANIYVNNVHVGNQAGLMKRGKYEITNIVNRNGVNVIAILIYHMTKNFNTWEMPSYLAGAGWDWMPPVPGFDRGITGKVFLSTSDNVGIIDPFMRTLSIAGSSATLSLSTQLRNYSDTGQTGTLTTIINPGNIRVSTAVALNSNENKTITFPNYVLNNAKLWWPNGYGDPNLYNCKMIYTINGKVSDSTSFNFGVRKFDYKNDKYGALNIYCNGKKIFIRGGNWGMSEFMLRVHGKDYDPRIRFHKEMGFNMIRNWAGTETDDEFYDYCDKYGIMLWEEFWMNNGINFLYDLPTYLANLPEKVLKERNHAAIAVWCGSNECIQWYDKNVHDTVYKYDLGDRLYQSSSNSSNIDDNTQFGLKGQGGLGGDGGYSNVDLKSYFRKSANKGNDPFNSSAVFVGNYGFYSELGVACFPTSESFKLFMPADKLWPSNNVWTFDHFFGATGRGDGAGPGNYMNNIANKYGASNDIEDFCRKAQISNIENHKAMFESFGDHMWNDASAVLMWMSQSAFPTMIWQTYDYYLDCTGGYWGAKKACEPLHIQWSIASDSVKVINATSTDYNNLTASFNIYDTNGVIIPGYGDTTTINVKSDTLAYCFPGVNGTDLAFNKPAFASSTTAGTPSVLFDGDPSTRWSSAFTDNEYIGVDLGSPKTFSYVSLIWQTAYGKSYQIQVSNDKNNWTTVYSTTTGDGGTDNISFTPVTARYVRMLGTQRGSIFGYSLYEFYVYPTAPAVLSDVYFLKMKLTDATGKVLSDNLYWRSNSEKYTSLNNIPVITLQQTTSTTVLPNGHQQITLNLTNPVFSAGMAFAVHVQLLNPDGSRVLPVFMNDNYFTIMKGESKTVTIEYDTTAAKGVPHLLIEQYNSRNPNFQLKTGSFASPDHNLQMNFNVTNNKVYYTVTYKGQTVLGSSQLGLKVNNAALNNVSQIAGIQSQPVTNSYATLGKHSKAVDNYTDGIISFKAGGSNDVFALNARVYNDGVAFRYIAAQGSSGSNAVNIDSTQFAIPTGSTIWSQGDISAYEGKYQQQTIDNVGSGQTVGPPLTIKLPNSVGYASITEGGNTNFGGMWLKSIGGNKFMANIGATTVTGTVVTPWRIIEFGPDLNTLVNADIVDNVSPAADPTLFPNGVNTDWVKPGQSIWSWISHAGGVPQFDVNYNNMLKYVKLAGKLGISYNLLDQGWEQYFPTGNRTKWDVLKQLVDSANAVNVKLWVWKPYTPQNNAFFPDSGIVDSTARLAFFQKCAQAGVAGLKIDFFTGEQQAVYQWQQGALRDAAKLHLMLDFHGVVKPTGQQRTWPNELSREAIRGLENQTNNTYPSHNTILPFTRFLAGFADYTPFSFRQDVIAGTTLAHQVGTVITFTSPFMCLAANPDTLLVSNVKSFVTAIPTTWDETRVLPPSEIGQIAVFARRKGTTWYLSILNGPTATTASISLSFLNPGSYKTTVISDVTGNVSKVNVNTLNYSNTGNISVPLSVGGGFVAKFEQ